MEYIFHNAIIGWYHSGDHGYYEENGEIIVLGRSKELIRFRHADIHPSYVETILLSHPDVEDAAVVGIQHDLDVEHPVAFVKVAQHSNVRSSSCTCPVKRMILIYRFSLFIA